MKKIVFGILMGFMVVFTSCLKDDDGYSLNKAWVGFGMVHKGNSNQIVMDNGDVLLPVAYSYPTNDYDYGSSGENRQLKDGDRVLVNYTILDDRTNDAGKVVAYLVRVNSAQKVLLKGILDITEANKDSIGNNPILVKDWWMTDSLLNFQLKYWGRNKVHFINLVKQPGALSADGQPFELELRHNSNGDDEAIPFNAFVSFNLDNLRITGLDSVKFVVKGTDYDKKEFKIEGTYKYGEKK